jgi:hypothetical protein
VAVAHYEWRLGEGFFQFHPACRYSRDEMRAYAEANLTGVSRQDGRNYLCAFVNDNNPAFQALVRAHGYAKQPEGTRPLYRFDNPDHNRCRDRRPAGCSTRPKRGAARRDWRWAVLALQYERMIMMLELTRPAFKAGNPILAEGQLMGAYRR